jgi:hypothetical protein
MRGYDVSVIVMWRGGCFWSSARALCTVDQDGDTVSLQYSLLGARFLRRRP